jgi:hypothetical protein
MAQPAKNRSVSAKVSIRADPPPFCRRTMPARSAALVHRVHPSVTPLGGSRH